MPRFRSLAPVAALLITIGSVNAQQPSTSAGGETWVFDTHTPGACSPTGAEHGGCDPGELVRVRVVTVASGLVRPWHLTFLPGSTDMLVTELPGALRLVKNGILQPAPIGGWPSPAISSRTLNSAVLHPQFQTN